MSHGLINAMKKNSLKEKIVRHFKSLSVLGITICIFASISIFGLFAIWFSLKMAIGMCMM